MARITRTALTSALHRTGHLIQRQIQHVIALINIDHYLAGLLHDVLKGAQIETVAHHTRRLGVLAQYTAKACCIPSGATDNARLISLCILDHAGYLSKGLRQDLVGVGIPLVNLTLTILPGFDGIIKGCEHLLWRLHVLNGNRTDLNTSSVAI